MGWEGQYYYRKRRVGSRVVSEYVGGDILGEYAAQLDAHERHQAALQRKQWNTIRDEQAAIDKELDDIGAQVAAFVTATLLASGHHKHKRQWRKQRNGQFSRTNAE